MKKKSCLTLALILVMIQVISLFAVVPANAEESLGRSYNIYPIDPALATGGETDADEVAITDGAVETLWESIPASESFVRVGGGAEYEEGQIFDATFKAGWVPVAGDSNLITLHFMVEVKDTTRSLTYGAAYDSARFSLVDIKNNSTLYHGDYDSSKLHCLASGYASYLNGGYDGRKLANASAGEGKTIKIAVQDVADGYILDLNVQIEKQAQIAFDIAIVDNVTGTVTSGNAHQDYVIYSWNGMKDGVVSEIPEGIGYIVDPEEGTAQNKVHSIYPVPANATYDTNANVVEDWWEKLPAFSQFSHAYDSDNENPRPDYAIFDATLKAAWKSKDANTITIYLLLEVEDNTRYAGVDGKYDNFTVAFEDDGYIYYRTPHTMGYDPYDGWKFFDVNGTQSTKGLVVGVVNTDDGYRAKVSFDIKKTEELKFDLAVQDNYDNANGYTRISWNGWDGDVYGAAPKAKPQGICRIASEPIGIYMTPGASVRVDTKKDGYTGIRFANSIDIVRYNELIEKGATITTGTLIIPTQNLSAAGVADANFTVEGLEAAGLKEGKHFYNIVNKGNEWVAGEDGTWYATLYDIKDYTRQFSAVGYVTVEMDGVSTTYYAQYKVAYARSIAQVAETVMYGEIEGDDGRWTAAQEAVLNSFFTQEA